MKNMGNMGNLLNIYQNLKSVVPQGLNVDPIFPGCFLSQVEKRKQLAENGFRMGSITHVEAEKPHDTVCFGETPMLGSCGAYGWSHDSHKTCISVPISNFDGKACVT